MSESKAIILGCEGASLSEAEKSFFTEQNPWGFILFGRNIVEADQLQQLVASLRKCVGRQDAPIFIDQEGGRVQRIKPPLAPSYPCGADIGKVYDKDPALGLRAAWILSRLHAFDLLKFGINANCLPVLDVPVEGSHDVIGNRAYSNNPKNVAIIGNSAAEGLLAGGVLPVIKHIPGHGRGCADSHLNLPIVDTSLPELTAHDFVPFVEMRNAPMAMTAHIVYSAIDAQNPATTSSVVISEIIREKIGFLGLLMSDDVSMKALSGDLATKTDAIFAAGCDILLHCNGVMSEMMEIAHLAPVLKGQAKVRAGEALGFLRVPDLSDEAELRIELDALVNLLS